MASPQIDKVLKIYKSVVQNPSLSTAKIIRVVGNGVTVQSKWSQRNLERHTNQRFVQEHVLDFNLQVVSESFPIDITTEVVSVLSDDEQRRAVLRSATVDNASRQFIEIWDRQHLVKNYDLTALDVHGDVYTDSEFGAFQWSPDKSKLLYIAEKNLPKSEAFYKQKSVDKKEKEKREEEKTSKGNEYIYKPHWGEQLVGKHRPVVVILNTNTDTINALTGVPDDLSPGQVLWTPDGQDVVGVAWRHEPRYLGLIACSNRDSWIFLLKNGEFKKISLDGYAVRSPRFSLDGKYLVWLEREADGPHHNAHRLMRMEWESSREKMDILIDVIHISITINNEKQFYGLYDRSLPRRCWSADSKYLFLSTAQRSNVRSYVVNVETKVVTEIENDSSSLTILDVRNDVIAFVRTSLIEPSRLTIGRFNSQASSIGNITRTEITSPQDIPGLENIKYEQIEHLYDNNDEVKQFNSIYFGPKDGDLKSTPLIVAPHGGPHASFANVFSLDHTVFALLGFGILQVNFRGSTGMGAKNVEFLQGKVGDVDVKDCIEATQEALRRFPWLDPMRMGLSGGSHGGFLVAHLSGQYSNLFRAVVARNPVIDIAAMYTISDIPDCRNTLSREERIAFQDCACTAVIAYPFHESIPQQKSVEMFVKMFNCSPIVHADKVRAPTLICIGTNDLRVPCSQGILWYHRLKANNVKTRMLVYEDNHPLGSGPVEIDNIINGALWLLEHTAAQEL